MNGDRAEGRWLAPYVGATFILLLLLASAGIVSSAGPDACIACHSESGIIKAAVKSWNRSSHASIACAACHVPTGVKGLVSSNLWHALKIIKPGGDRSVPFVSKDSSWRDVPVDRCRRCHSPEKRRFTVRRGLNMEHEPHLKNGVACSTCHNLVAHPQDKKDGSMGLANNLDMIKGCWRCHGVAGKFRDPKLLATLPRTASPPRNCSTCHNNLWNLKPSKGEINHQDENGIAWRVGTLRHGKVAKKIGFNLCFGCHDRQKWCGDQCHSGIAMPHNSSKYARVFARASETDWRAVHYKVAAAKGRQVCEKCHNSVWLKERNSDFCMRCHHKQFYESNPRLGSPWLKVAMPFVKQNGAGKCWSCHKPEFCVTCHTTGMKPPPGKTFMRAFDVLN